MKMKTDNIIEALNKVVDKAREEFKLNANGHLVAVHQAVLHNL